MRKISPHAVVASDALIAEGVDIGPFCVLGAGVVLAENVRLGAGCILANGVRIEAGTIIGSHAVLEKNAIIGSGVSIGHQTTVYAGTQVGDGSRIGGGVSLGRLPKASAASTVKASGQITPLKIGENCIIGCSAVIYADSVFGKDVFLGDGALVREKCFLSDAVVVGSGCIVENSVRIGTRTKIQSGAYITAYMDIEEKVFIAPMVVTTNDNYMGRTEKRFQSVKGATIRRRARVGGGAVLLPGVEIGEESFVAAGALVTKDTPAAKVVLGQPAGVLRDVPREELEYEG